MLKLRFLALIAAGLVALSPVSACDLGDIVTKGSTDRSVALDIIDSTDGTPETGVVFNTSGIDLWYRREGAAVTSVTEVTLAALTTAHTDGGFLAVSHGAYRFDLPDAAFATGANYVDIGGTVTGMVVICQRVRLVDYSLEDAVRGTAGTALPNAVAGASSGLHINGSNSGTTTLAALTITGTVTVSDGIVVTRSTSNQPGVSITGNGTGNGATITSGSGATGTGLAIVSAATNGSAVTAAGVGTGNGITTTGGATGHGLSAVGGATSGDGIRATGTAGNANGMNLVGQGSANGLLTTGGATGHGISAVGGATSGSGLRAVAATSGSGILATGVGTTQPGILATGGATSSAGISAAGGGTGAGILATAGATGHGLSAVGGATSGDGIRATGTAGNANGLNLVGQGSANGLLTTGGATGHGISAVGGATSGNGVRAAGTAGNSDALNLIGQGSANGLLATGGATGNGFSLVGGATSGNPISTAYTAPLGQVKGFGILESGNLQTSSSTTAVLRSATNFPDTTLEGATVVLTGGTGVGQRRTCSAWTSASDTCTVTAWATTPDTTTTYEVWGTASSTGGGGGLDAAGTRAALGLATANLDMQLALAARPLLTTGTAQAGAANTITLAAGASATNGLYDPGMIRILSGTGAGQARVIISYDGTTKVAAVDRDWRTNPASDSVYEITPAENLFSTNEGIAAGGAASTITLNSTASATDNYYNGSLVYLRSSTGQDQARVITGYVGSTKVATVDSAWATNPAAGTGYAVVPFSRGHVTSYLSGQAPLQPTVAGRTLDVTATGGAGVDWANVENPTTSLGLTNTTISTTQQVASVSGNVGGNVVGSVATATALGANAITAAATAPDFATEINTGMATQTSVDDIPTNAELAAALGTADDATLAAVAALPASIRDAIVEDQGNITRGCIESVLLAYAAGDIVTVAGTTTYRDPSNGEIRIVGTVTSNGNRTATITCPTY
jgi:hypothetical protein